MNVRCAALHMLQPSHVAPAVASMRHAHCQNHSMKWLHLLLLTSSNVTVAAVPRNVPRATGSIVALLNLLVKVVCQLPRPAALADRVVTRHDEQEMREGSQTRGAAPDA